MNEEIEQLKDTLASMRTELDELKSRLARISRYVTVDNEDDDGVERVYMECTDFTLRPAHDRRQIAAHVGAGQQGVYFDLHYPGMEHNMHTAIRLSVDEEGVPHVQVFGRDWKTRLELMVQNDHGLAAVLGAEGAPGAVMRALPGGGSVAVLQPDGRTRGVLFHQDGGEEGQGAQEKASSTDLLFASAQGSTVLKLHTDGTSSFMAAGTPAQPDGAVLGMGPDGGSLMLHSKENKNSISMMCGELISCLKMHPGKVPDGNDGLSLLAGDFGSSIELHDEKGAQRVDISALGGGAGLVFLKDGEDEALALRHAPGSHSSLSMRGGSKAEGVFLFANDETAFVKVTSPDDETCHISASVAKGSPSLMVTDGSRPLVMAGRTEHGGVICAYGLKEAEGGIASLSGGPLGGELAICSNDGTRLMTLHSTDHGGRMLINNDLGMQRVTLAAYDEAGSMVLNNTGSNGLIATVTPEGGRLTLLDPEGKMLAQLP